LPLQLVGYTVKTIEEKTTLLLINQPINQSINQRIFHYLFSLSFSFSLPDSLSSLSICRHHIKLFSIFVHRRLAHHASTRILFYVIKKTIICDNSFSFRFFSFRVGFSETNINGRCWGLLSDFHDDCDVDLSFEQNTEVGCSRFCNPFDDRSVLSHHYFLRLPPFDLVECQPKRLDQIFERE